MDHEARRRALTDLTLHTDRLDGELGLEELRALLRDAVGVRLALTTEPSSPKDVFGVAVIDLSGTVLWSFVQKKR